VQTLVGVSIVLIALLLYSPWSLRELHFALTSALLHSLRKPAVGDQAEVELLLEKSREDVIRYK
jgi:hypothetical protein